MTTQSLADDPFQVATMPADNARLAGFDLREILAMVYRSRYWIIGILAVCLTLAILFTLLATPFYSSSASIEVRQEADKVLGTEADRENPSSRLDAERFLQTQLDIIRSKSVATTVAENLGLFRGDTFLEAMHAGKEKPSAILSPREAHREYVLKVLTKGLSVSYTGDTRIAVLTYTSPDPRLAARIANGYADAFIRNSLERRANSSNYALDFLRQQLAEAQERLQRSERAAVDYARQTRIVDASNAAGAKDQADSQPQSLVTAQLVQLNQAFANATTQRIDAEQKWRNISSLSLMNIPDVLSNDAIQRLVERRAQLEASRREQLANRQSDFPAVRQITAQVTAIDGQISALAGSIRNSIRSQYDVAASRERELAQRLDSLKNSTLAEQNQAIQLSILRREADTNRQQYDALLRRYNALNAESGVQTNNLAIVDRADVPDRRSSPRLLVNVALALAAGLILAGIFVVLREQLMDTVRTPQDVADRLKIPLLGTVPISSNPVVELVDTKSATSEAINSIRTSLLLSGAGGLPRSVMVTSTQASEGKSSTCYALGRSLVRLGKTVVIIDMDLRRPKGHEMFGVPNKEGISNVLAGQATIDAVIHASDLPGLSFITAGPTPPNPSDLIGSKQLSALIETLGNRFDVVLIDSAPVLGLADAVFLSASAEATIFVIEAARNSARGVQQAIKRLTDVHGNIVGAILTKFDPVQLGYGAYSGYGYSYAYKYSSDD